MMLKIIKISLATIIFISIFPTQIASAPVYIDGMIPVIPKVPLILQKISKCESKDRQFNSDGSVYRGKINPKDVGKYQINEYYHLKASRALGMDIYTLEGNTKYALYLFKHQGTTPWNWSKKCWDK